MGDEWETRQVGLLQGLGSGLGVCGRREVEALDGAQNRVQEGIGVGLVGLDDSVHHVVSSLHTAHVEALCPASVQVPYFRQCASLLYAFESDSLSSTSGGTSLL